MTDCVSINMSTLHAQQRDQEPRGLANVWAVSSRRARKKRVAACRQRRRWRVIVEKREKKSRNSKASHQKAQQEKRADTGVAAALVATLKACAKQKDLQEGSRIHTDIVQRGFLQKKAFVGNTLVSMYAKCGALEKAQEVFDELQAPNVVSWNALLSGYAQNGHGKEALKRFKQMQNLGLSPNAFTFSCILKACCCIGAVDTGQEIHAQIIKEGLLGKDIVVANTLLDMYAKCGALQKAQELFDECFDRDLVSWNVLITGYSQRGLGEQALKCFEQMQLGGFCPDAITFTSVLEACGNMGASGRGEEIHAQIMRHTLPEKKGLVVGTALVDMYAKCGVLEKAQEVFDKLPGRDLVSWNALIAGYVQHGHSKQAISCFERMQCGVFSANASTFTCILKACGDVRALDTGQKIHTLIVKECLLEKDIALGTALVDMYAKCDALKEAQEVFDELPARDVKSWNVLITRYAQCGYLKEAMHNFKQMEFEGLFPDAVTIDCILKVCGSKGDSETGQEIHAQIVREGFLEDESLVADALLDMYAKFGELEKFENIFDELRIRNIGSWNVLIAGYARNELAEEALACFQQMQCDGFFPDSSTFAYFLKACGSIGAANRGLEIHSEMVKHELEGNMVVSTALMIMYASCGMLVEARSLFDKVPVKDVVMWSALMVGYAQMGMDKTVFKLYDKMVQEGIEPNAVTFTAVLSACSHIGLLDKGQKLFEILSKIYCIVPTLEHYTCMVDIFARSGHLDNAIALIEEVPLFANRTTWFTLLGGCQKWGDSKLASLAFEGVIHLNEDDACGYVSTSNIFAIDTSRTCKTTYKL